MSEDRQSHRKVYAKGFYDGLRSLSNQPETPSMNQAKFESSHRELTIVSKKVYSATPIAEAWNAFQIFEEMKRVGTGGCNDLRAVKSYLNSLINAGLVIEPEPGMFVRKAVRVPEPVKPKLLIVQKEAVEVQSNPIVSQPKTPEKPEKPETADFGPIEQLSKLSTRVLQMVAALQVLASDIDNAAISIAEQGEKKDGETKKLRQLQELLKSLG